MKVCRIDIARTASETGTSRGIFNRSTILYANAVRHKTIRCGFEYPDEPFSNVLRDGLSRAIDF